MVACMCVKEVSFALYARMCVYVYVCVRVLVRHAAMHNNCTHMQGANVRMRIYAMCTSHTEPPLVCLLSHTHSHTHTHTHTFLWGIVPGLGGAHPTREPGTVTACAAARRARSAPAAPGLCKPRRCRCWAAAVPAAVPSLRRGKEPVGSCMRESMDGCVDGWVDGWMSGWTDGWMDFKNDGRG